MLFNTLREQKAFTAFLSTLMVVGMVSGVALAKSASAADIYAFSNVSYTLKDARSSYLSSADVKFTTPNMILNQYGQSVAAPDLTAGSPLSITINGFTNPTGLAASDIVAATGGSTFVTSCTAAAGEILLGAPVSDVASTTIPMTVCATDTVVHGTSLNIDLGNFSQLNQVSSKNLMNPAAAGTYTYTIAGSVAGNTFKTVGKIAITNNVHVSATIDPTLTFNVSGVNANTTFGTDVTTATTSSSTMALGTLTTAQDSVAAQTIAGATNAKNGMAVTIQATSPFQSANGATIDGMNNGTVIQSNLAYATPTVAVGNDGTWGTIAMRSSAAGNVAMGGDLTASTNWTGALFGGHVNGSDILPVTVKVMDYARPIRASEASTTLVFRVNISDIQEAATDYKTDLVYVATPNF